MTGPRTFFDGRVILHAGDCRLVDFLGIRKNKFANRAPHTKAAIRNVATCRSCAWAWKPQSGYIKENCPRCGKPKDVRARSDSYVGGRMDALKVWCKANPESGRETNRRYRKTALLIVGGGVLSCAKCGCDRPELLEINHINGGGAKEFRQKGKSVQFYRNIASLKRDTCDLELLCKPCNAIHALELIHGPLPFAIKWGSK